jgi:hypothetical protein
VEDDLAKYLEVKQQILLSYCTNILFYMLMKVTNITIISYYITYLIYLYYYVQSEGKSVRSHPVMKQLLHLRYQMLFLYEVSMMNDFIISYYYVDM